MRDIRVIAHDIRSTHNVGSLLRTCEGLGVTRLYFTGYTPYPGHDTDTRLPHLAQKLTAQISKTALGAETLQAWEHHDDISELLAELRAEGFQIFGLEQSKKSIKLPDFKPTDKIVLLLGREVEGLEQPLMEKCDELLEIPMYGKKESFNVVQAAAMVLYHVRFAD